MTLYFPDLNVWLALSVESHTHAPDAWNWFGSLPGSARLLFSRFTQLGLLRLLTNEAVMGEQTLTLRKAWNVFDAWIDDPRVEFQPEPRGVDEAFRHATEPFASKHATKWIADCYLLAHAAQSGAVLVTFDAGLHSLAKKNGHRALRPV